MTLIPARFLFRVCYPCKHVPGIPRLDADTLLDLPSACRLDFLTGFEGRPPFAEVRMAWNAGGIGIQAEVTGKKEPPRGDAAHPATSDGVTVWLDTRDARTNHRATRFCHQFHLLPAGGGAERDEPAFAQARINRALGDATSIPAGSVPFRCHPRRGGYLLEAFLPGPLLVGFDPEQNPRLGVFVVVRDAEKGEQHLGVGPEFPYWEDPSLWNVLAIDPPSG